MKRPKKILIAADSENISSDLIEYGLTYGQLTGAQIKCILLQKDERVLATVGGSMQSMVNASIAKLNDENLLVESEVVIGNIFENIILESKQWEADVIVVGANTDLINTGHTNLVKDLLNMTEANVIIVPTSFTNQDIDKIGVFINFQFEELAMVLNIIDMSRENNLEVLFIHVLDNERNALHMKAKLQIYHRLFDKDIKTGRVSFKISSQEITDVISEVTEEEGVDLIALRSFKRHWSLLFPQTEYNLLKFIKAPMLVWKDKIN